MRCSIDPRPARRPGAAACRRLRMFGSAAAGPAPNGQCCADTHSCGASGGVDGLAGRADGRRGPLAQRGPAQRPPRRASTRWSTDPPSMLYCERGSRGQRQWEAVRGSAARGSAARATRSGAPQSEAAQSGAWGRAGSTEGQQGRAAGRGSREGQHGGAARRGNPTSRAVFSSLICFPPKMRLRARRVGKIT